MPPNFLLKNGQNFEKKVAKLANWPGLVSFRVATQNWPICQKMAKNRVFQGFSRRFWAKKWHFVKIGQLARYFITFCKNFIFYINIGKKGGQLATT